MTELPQVVDQQARLQILDCSSSYAIQAPAGSGKTELLTLRFMKLLASATEPEEILAITFTRKAAAEMADRIISALQWAASIPDHSTLESPLLRLRFEQAKAVLQRDQEMAWQLLESPGRLRIQTIDSLCLYLNRRLPVLSGFGSLPAVTEQIDDCILEAIRNTLDLVNSEDQLASSISSLLLHLDNNQQRVEGLLTKLLYHREHWAQAILSVSHSPTDAQDYFKRSILELIDESLDSVRTKLAPYKKPLLSIVDFVSDNLIKAEIDSKMTLWHGLDDFPETNADTLDHWCGLAELMLTRDANWRRKVDKRSGFPAKGSTKDKELAERFDEKKASFLQLLDSLGQVNGLQKELEYVQLLPTPATESVQWDFVLTLTEILPTLLAQLKLSFGRHNKVDYSEMATTALSALGTEQQPTDLALALDYQIKHILVDEFQDTSLTQMRLLEKLAAGWQPGDGRSLFIVGDGMQSCYGFRNANVGLFLTARQKGIGSVPMQALDLQANFRSSSAIVNWVNAIFSKAFPAQANISRGAVSYSASTAAHTANSDLPEIPAVSCRIFTYEEDHKTQAYISEATHLVSHIRELRRLNADDTVAILVRMRSHLKYLLPALTAADISWQANEIHPLANMSVIADLTSLLRALTNYADRLAWLSILRAPWCGVTIADLHALTKYESRASIWHNMCRVDQVPLMSEDGKQRIAKLTSILGWVLEQKNSLSISRLLRISWRLLHGHALTQTDSEHSSVERLFKLVSSREIAGVIDDMPGFEQELQRLFVSGQKKSTDHNPVQIMTIHKAKGLEFDHVILPGLARIGRADDKPLLLHDERLNRAGEARVFLAAMAATGAEKNSLYELLRYEKNERTLLENTRLLYVGATRAIKSLQLLATLQRQEEALSMPAKNSLLATIWQALNSSCEYQPELIAVASEATANDLEVADDCNNSLHRFSCALPVPDFITSAPAIHALNNHRSNEDLALVDRLQADVGIIIHRLLQLVVQQGISYFSAERLQSLKPGWSDYLTHLGYATAQIDSAVERVETTITKTLEAENINWIFNQKLQDSQAELAIHSIVEGNLRTDRLDLSFIDEHDVRWIVDYKTAEPAKNQSNEDFVAQQLYLHAEQLARYKARYLQFEPRQIKTALLLTAIPQLVEVGNQ